MMMYCSQSHTIYKCSTGMTGHEITKSAVGMPQMHWGGCILLKKHYYKLHSYHSTTSLLYRMFMVAHSVSSLCTFHLTFCRYRLKLPNTRGLCELSERMCSFRHHAVEVKERKNKTKRTHNSCTLCEAALLWSEKAGAQIPLTPKLCSLV